MNAMGLMKWENFDETGELCQIYSECLLDCHNIQLSLDDYRAKLIRSNENLAISVEIW